jgi:hypothetical protein
LASDTDFKEIMVETQNIDMQDRELRRRRDGKKRRGTKIPENNILYYTNIMLSIVHGVLTPTHRSYVIYTKSGKEDYSLGLFMVYSVTLSVG